MTDDAKSLKKRVMELEEIHNLAQSLSSLLTVYETLEAICECCMKLCKAERSAILLLSPRTDESAQTVVRGSSASSDQEIEHFVNEFVAGWVDHHKRPLLTDNLAVTLKITGNARRIQKLGPGLAVPLMVEGKMVGVINLVNSQGGEEFSEDNLRVLTLIAPLAAQFLHQAKMRESLFEDNKRLKSALQQTYGADAILGQSPPMKALKEKIKVIAASSASVLIIGETGTGKELVAKAVHCLSQRAEKSFLAVNCAAIPATLFESELFGHERGAFTGATEAKKGKFEIVNEGTLFLDEISSLPLELQPKLLRVLEQRSFTRVGSAAEISVDVRVIAATNQDLRAAVERGMFREDLYHRLNVIPIELPPLRDRLADIPLLAQSFLAQFSGGGKEFAPDALQLLSRLEWKGNVRELRNVVERISLFEPSHEITAAHLRNQGVGSERREVAPLSYALRSLIHSNEANKDLIEVIEKELVEVALREAQGNVSKASRLLGIDRNALQRRLDKYGLSGQAH